MATNNVFHLLLYERRPHGGIYTNVKGSLPGILILLVGLPIIYSGSRRDEEKPEKEEQKKKKN
jgi:hypothetical protein